MTTKLVTSGADGGALPSATLARLMAATAAPKKSRTPAARKPLTPASKKPLTPASKKPLTYAAAGVDIDAGDEVVDRIKPIVRRTYSPRVLGLHGAFAGMFKLNGGGKKYKDPVLVGCTDGVGTKVMLAAEFKIYDTVGIDCVAMNVNDLIVQGAEPLFFLDYLGLSKLDPTNTTAMIAGVAKGCEIAGCALIGGECAEMPDIYSPGDFDVAGFCVGVIEHERIKTSEAKAKAVKPPVAWAVSSKARLQRGVRALPLRKVRVKRVAALSMSGTLTRITNSCSRGRLG